jgi:hypothetical protein
MICAYFNVPRIDSAVESGADPMIIHLVSILEHTLTYISIKTLYSESFLLASYSFAWPFLIMTPVNGRFSMDLSGFELIVQNILKLLPELALYD